MATKFDTGLTLSGQTLIESLTKKISKREIDKKYTGLQRSLALSDLTNRSQALNNILSGISNLETSERNQYGSIFNSSDWNVTGDFIQQGINKNFLSQLNFSSSLQGQVSVTPRIRIQDQITSLNSFYGEGSFPGYHNGLDAQFYKPPQPAHKGFIKFDFNDLTGSVTVSELIGTDGVTTLSPSSLLNGKSQIVVILDSYTASSGEKISLTGVEVNLKLVSPTTWSVSQGLSKLIAVKNSLTGSDVFSGLAFRFSQEYTLLNPPPWFAQSPANAAVEAGADDLNPATSHRLLVESNGSYVPVKNKGYWYTKSAIFDRWSANEQGSITLVQTDYNKVFVLDSNMEWKEPPTELKSEVGNWGVRWDGYIKIVPDNYLFQVQTNVLVKIDMAIGANSSWVNVFDSTSDPVLSDVESGYVSSQSFDGSTISEQFKYYTSAVDWSSYVPITIRMYYGQADRAFPNILSPQQPNLFIKTTTLTTPVAYSDANYEITIAGSDVSGWTITSPALADIISALQNTQISVTYTITGTASGSVLPVPVLINMTTNGTTVSSISQLGLDPGSYVLKLTPYRSDSYIRNAKPLWRGKLASPSPDHQNYSDMTDGSFSPDLLKTSFDMRPEWWKITRGHPYNLALPPSRTNTPLDGFLTNKFKPVLSSEATGVGLYGSGDGVTFSSRPNIICGEARYSTSDPLGSNYTGIRLLSNSFGEGGRLIVNALPLNNSLYNSPDLLGQNDLGGFPNHLTAGSTNLISYIARLYLRETASPADLYNKYYLIANPTLATASDDPTAWGLPPFSSPLWLSPITVFVVSVADDLIFTTNVKSLVSPLTLSVEKKTVSGFDLLCFTTTQSSILVGGSEKVDFASKYVNFYTESNIAFQYGRVDTGDSLSFADCLKITYVNNELQPLDSEVPRPPSDRVTPFGFDRPQFTKDLCYPPYVINNPLLSDIAVEDTTLYSAPAGNYDVFWGDNTKAALGGNTLTLLQKLEFQSYDKTSVQTVSNVTLQTSFYTHKMKIELPIDTDVYDQDVTEFFGNGESVKDSFYLFVSLNG